MFRTKVHIERRKIMSLVLAKDLLDDAYKNGYAVGGFDAKDILSAEAIIEAAEQTKTPVLLMVAEMWFPTMDVDTYFCTLRDRVRQSSAEIALFLDHSESFESTMKAIYHGFTGVMIDGSSLPNKDNIAITKKVVEVAHAAGVCVEAEIGHVGGNDRGGAFSPTEADVSRYTNPKDAADFVEQTGVDALAVAFGNVHGVYKGTPKLDFNRLDEIKEKVKIPLVMHGGSGLIDDDYRGAIKHGINKFNFFTGLSKVGTKATIDACEAAKGNLHFFEIAEAAKSAMKTYVSNYIAIMKK